MKPNGIAFSPDFKTLYVTDTGASKGNEDDFVPEHPHDIHAFEVIKNPVGHKHKLGAKRLFAVSEEGAPDGILCDASGHVFTGCEDGVNVFTKDGKLIGKFAVGKVHNFVFADNLLVMLREDKVLAVELQVKGMQLP